MEPRSVEPGPSKLPARPARWHLLPKREAGWSLTGWLSFGGAYNTASPDDRYNGPVTFPDRSNQFTLYEAHTSVENKRIVGGDGWSLGARVDLFYGSNARFLTAAGLESTWNGHGAYGLAMPFANLELKTGDVTTLLGHFVSPVGYFIVGSANNYFNVLPYTFEYGEPFTHTGFWSSWQASDEVAIGGGVIGGWDSFADWDSANAGLVDNAWNRHAGALLTASKTNLVTKRDAFSYVGVWGQEPDLTAIGRSSRYLQTLVYNVQLTDEVNWVAQSDFGWQADAVSVASGRANDAEWFGINQYLTWQLDPEWSVGMNLEWFRDNDGFRVVGAEPSFGSPRATSFGRGPFQGDFYRAILGGQWSPHPNLVVRPALVFDVFAGRATGAAQGLPFDDGTARTQLLAIVDVLVFF